MRLFSALVISSTKAFLRLTQLSFCILDIFQFVVYTNSECKVACGLQTLFIFIEHKYNAFTMGLLTLFPEPFNTDHYPCLTKGDHPSYGRQYSWLFRIILNRYSRIQGLSISGCG